MLPPKKLLYHPVLPQRIKVEIRNNSGLRSISKLCLNSLWGKFGQRSNMNQTTYVTEPTEFYKILLDDTVENLNIQFVNDDMVQMTYNFKDHFIVNSNKTDIYIACFTKSYARLMLYDKLDYYYYYL